MKKITKLLLLLMVIFTLAACSSDTADLSGVIDIAQPATVSDWTNEAVDTNQQTRAATAIPVTVKYDSEDLETSVNNAEMTIITLDGNDIIVKGDGATINGSSVTIAAAGTYLVRGTLDDGQILVDAAATDLVILVLDGVEITSSSSAPIYIANADKVVMTLAEGSENTVTDSDTYINLDESSEPNAAIFSNDDLTINGSGALTVNANYNNGITSDDDLKITGGTIMVNAVNDGIKGRDSLAVKDGLITIIAGADGLQSNNNEDPEKGYVIIEGGTLNITSALDGIQAETNLQINDGDFTIMSGGGSVNSSTTGAGIWGGPGMEGNPNKPIESAKGLKAGMDVIIMAGTLNISSADDSIHANNSVTINDGDILMSSGDDGIHADAALTINGGEINLTQSYEGLESAIITVNSGTIHLNASDDGINAGGGADSSSVDGRPGQNQFAIPGNYYVYINGGYIFIDANGDGLDTNGSFAMTDGVVIINGPTNNGNGPLDYMGTFNVSGGFIVAVGSSGMAQAPSDTSTQYSVLYNFDSVQSAGTLVQIQTDSGQEILTFMPTKEYQSVMISSPELQNGETYVVYTGGSSTGIVTDGLYTGGDYMLGTQVANFAISSMVTSNGSMVGGFPGGRPGGFGGDRPTQP